MGILERIVKDKRKEVSIRKEVISVTHLEGLPFFERKCISLSQRLKNSSTGIIAEFKRRSPSKSDINYTSNVWEVATEYEKAGVSGMSVLTDSKYFGGSLEDLVLARASCDLPILRKEFIIDEFQILEAKANGADVILLIAAILSSEEIKNFLDFAHSLSLEVLVEVHNEAELQKVLMPGVSLVGVNNRNLKTFEVSLKTSESLSKVIPNGLIKISESGISSVEAINTLKGFGYQGFLMGENFMRQSNPGESAKQFIEELNKTNFNL